MTMKKKMLKVGVVGLGPIGNRHADIYQEIKGVELVSVCDIIRKKADSTGKRLGVPYFYSLEDMLRNSELDMVSVATGGIDYSSDHYKPVMQALDAGLHVLCEKPICHEIKKSEEMVRTAGLKKLYFGINFNHRFTPAARLAKKWINDGLIGHQLFINMAMWIGNPNNSSPYFQIKSLNAHSVDIMRYFCGDIKEVQCFAVKAPGRKIYSTAQFNMKFKNNVLGHLTGSYDVKRGHPMERCEVAGLNGRFVLEDMYRELTLYPADNLVKKVYTNPIFGGMRDFKDTFQERLKYFIDQIKKGVKPDQIEASGKDGLEAQRVLHAAIKSLETNSIVKLANIKK